MNGTNRYREEAVTTSDGRHLVVMLYEGAINFMKKAKEFLQKGDMAGKGIYIGKAQAIIAELNNSLNDEAAPEISANLRKIYNFIHMRLTEANIRRDPSRLDDCIGMMEEMLEAWKKVEQAG